VWRHDKLRRPVLHTLLTWHAAAAFDLDPNLDGERLLAPAPAVPAPSAAAAAAAMEAREQNVPLTQCDTSGLDPVVGDVVGNDAVTLRKDHAAALPTGAVAGTANHPR